VDAINSKEASVKESATIKVDQMESKYSELFEEVCCHLSSFGSLLVIDIILCFVSILQIAAIPHES
jgi:hypothetical protein